MRIAGRLFWPLLGAVALTVLLLPRPLFAQVQAEKTELTLTLFPRDSEVRVGEDNKLFLEVRNTGTRVITDIQLSAETPQGWTVVFEPRNIGRLGAGSVQTVDLFIRPADQTTEGSYTILFVADFVAEATKTREVESVRLTARRPELILALVAGRYSNEVRIGEENRLFLEVRNTGAKPVTGIRLSAAVPEGWTVRFEPASIDNLGAGSVRNVDLIIRPGGAATKGGYNITLIAEANETRRVESLFLTVKSSSFWLWIGIGIGAIVVAGFVFIFWRFGRQ